MIWNDLTQCTLQNAGDLEIVVTMYTFDKSRS